MRWRNDGKGMPPQVTSNLYRVWSFDQAATNAQMKLICGEGSLVPYLLAANNPTITNPAPIAWGRGFNGTSQYYYGIDLGEDAIALYGGDSFGLMALFRPDETLANAGTVLGYGGNGVGRAYNAFKFQVNTDFTLSLRWQYGAGGSWVAVTSTHKVPKADWSHVGWKYSAVNGYVYLYVNGVVAETFTNGGAGYTRPECDPVAVNNLHAWCIGADPGFYTNKFKGKICSAGVFFNDMPDDEVEDAFRRAMLWNPYSVVHLQVEPHDNAGLPMNPALIDVSNDFVIGATLHDDIDSPGRTATVRFRREIGSLSIAKYHETSPMNREPRYPSSIGIDGSTYTQDTTEYLAINRRMKIYFARTAPFIPRPAYSTTNWTLWLDGISDEPSWGKAEMTVEVHDWVTSRLITGYLEREATYSNSTGVAVETVMQSIFSDANSAGWIPDDPDTGAAPTIEVPTSPVWVIKEFRQRREPPWVAVKTLAEQIGWTIRRLWTPRLDRFETNLYCPERTRTYPHCAVDSSLYFDIPDIRISKAGIRTRTRTCYHGPAPTLIAPPSGYGRDYGAGGVDSEGNKLPAWVEWWDTAAEAKYGRIFYENAEASSSNIDTETEADSMCRAQLDDLKEPLVSKVVEMHPLLEIDVNDIIAFFGNGIHTTADLQVAVVSQDAEVGRDGARMTQRCRGKPATGFHSHLAKEARGGTANPPVDEGSDVSTGATWARRRLAIHELLVNTTISRSSRIMKIPNGDFSQRLFKSSGPPDGWVYYAGTEGVDIALNSTAGNFLSGQWSLALMTASAEARTRNFFEVMEGEAYQLEIKCRASDVVAQFMQGMVTWYTAAKAVVGTTFLINTSTASVTTWHHMRGFAVAPANARYAKLSLLNGTGTRRIYVDRVNFAAVMPGFRAFLNADMTNGGAGYAKGTTVQPTIATEATYGYDIGNMYDTSTYLATVPQTGIWRFVGQAGVLPRGGGNAIGRSILFLNGAGWVYGPVITASGYISTGAIAPVDSGLMWLAQGNTVGLRVQVENTVGTCDIAGGNAVGTSSYTYLSGQMIPQE